MRVGERTVKLMMRGGGVKVAFVVVTLGPATRRSVTDFSQP